MTALILWTTPAAEAWSSVPREQGAKVPVRKKKPVVKSIIDRFGGEGGSLKDLRIAALNSLGFAGFFRFNELANIQPNHIFFHEDFVKVFCTKK